MQSVAPKKKTLLCKNIHTIYRQHYSFLAYGIVQNDRPPGTWLYFVVICLLINFAPNVVSFKLSLTHAFQAGCQPLHPPLRTPTRCLPPPPYPRVLHPPSASLPRKILGKKIQRQASLSDDPDRPFLESFFKIYIDVSLLLQLQLARALSIEYFVRAE